MNQSFVSVVLPVYNQGDHIAKIVKEYHVALGLLKIRYELVLVPNACRDNSVSICRSLAKANKSVRVVILEKGGWGRAVKAGLGAAKGSTLCYTNSSRTSAEELATMILKAEFEPKVALKARRMERGEILRRLGSWLFNMQCRLLFGVRGKDVNGTPKIFPRHFSALLNLKRDDDLIDAEFNAVCKRDNYKVLEVPIFSSRRHGGRSTTKLASAFKIYVGAFVLWREFKKVL